jgi:hypothetical protein
LSSSTGTPRPDLDLEVEQEADRLLLDAVHHRGEHVEALALVLDQRVALGHRPQADALLQVVHLVEVLAPLAVEHREQHPALELAHASEPSSSSRRVVRRGRRLQLLDQQLGGRGRLARRRPPRSGRRGDRHRVELLERGPELVEVPVLGVALGGRASRRSGDDVVDHVLDLLVQVLALEHLAALGVDDLRCLVQHLVVLEDVLADLEVLRLDLGLRAAIARVTILFSIGTSSGMLSRSMTRSTIGA